MEVQTAQPIQAVDDEIEIDLMEIAVLLLRKSIWIGLSVLICAVMAFGYTRYFVTPIYTASSSIYILSSTTSITSLADLQIGESLTSDFQVIAVSRPVLETVIDALALDTTHDVLAESITASNISDTRILTLSVENPDAQLAADISNALSIALCDRVAELMSTDRPTTVETAIAAEYPSSPSTIKNVLVGAVLGFVLTAGIIVLVYLLDDTIKDADDVEKKLHLITLASLSVEVEDKGAPQRQF